MSSVLKSRRIKSTWVVLAAVLAIPLASAQTVKVPCTLAERLDLDTFTLLGNYDGSEAGQDSAADDLAQCWAAGLTRDLRQMPKLAARISTLRTLYQQLNSAEGDMAYDMMGGGTMYTHAIPRSFPGIEETLRTLAALAGSTSGAQVGQRYALSVTASSRAFASRVAALKTWKPKDLPDFDRRDFLSSLADYQKAGLALQKLLGSRGDAATAAGYLPLQRSMFVDEFLADDSLGSR